MILTDTRVFEERFDFAKPLAKLSFLWPLALEKSKMYGMTYVCTYLRWTYLRRAELLILWLLNETDLRSFDVLRLDEVFISLVLSTRCFFVFSLANDSTKRHLNRSKESIQCFIEIKYQTGMKLLRITITSLYCLSLFY